MRGRFTGWLIVAAVCLALLASVGVTEVRSSRGSTHIDLQGAAPWARKPVAAPSSTNSTEAIVTLGDRLPAVARRYGWSARRLKQLLLADSTLRVDSADRLFYVEPITAKDSAGSAASAAAVSAAAAPYPLSQTFNLHSLPGVKLTILLDFGGRTMTNNAWTVEHNKGATITCPPFSADASPGFSDAEKAIIQEVWQRVAEDYAPFSVDVTTEFTGEDAITRTSLADTVYGTRVLISPISSLLGAYGGYAYIDVFAETTDYYKPALVFPEKLNNNAKNIGEAAAHEAGHNLGLNHDGTAGAAYYDGSGSGETGWAPIMGGGYYQNLTQWSRGEYPGANNTEDDLAIVQSYLGYRADDSGDATASARVLPSNSTVATDGLIANSGDVDVYRFNAGTGPMTIDVKPPSVGPNLDVLAELRDGTGALLASSNPASSASAQLSKSLSAGTYYLFVRGTGKGSPLDAGGYSNYGSIGRYTLSGTVVAPAPLTTATPTPSGAFAGWVVSDVSVSLTATDFGSGVTWTRFSLGGLPEQTYLGTPIVVSTPGSTTLTYRSMNNAGFAETTKTATIRIDKAPPTTNIPGLAARYSPGGGSFITLVPSDPHSGVSATYWRIGTGGPYSAGVSVTVPSAEGDYTLQYYSVDAVGNTEGIRSSTFAVAPVPVTRIPGNDRYEVAAGLARKGWDPSEARTWPGVRHVIVACGEDRAAADPLAAAGLAGVYDAPILLVKSGSTQALPTATLKALAEIAKANPGVRIHIVGGVGSVPVAAWNRIRTISGVSQVLDRISGQSRYEVSANIARRVLSVWGDYRLSSVLIVCAENPAAFYDALAASPAAYSRHMPMIGVRSRTLEPAAMKVLGNEFKGKNLIFVNSDAYVSRGVKMAISGSDTPVSLATSSDRYAAARQIADGSLARGWLVASDIGLAAKLPDALTGGAFLGKRGGVLLFTDSSATIRSSSAAFITAEKGSVRNGWVVGGTGSLPTAQESSFAKLLK